jgi:hypothetical protein
MSCYRGQARPRTGEGLRYAPLVFLDVEQIGIIGHHERGTPLHHRGQQPVVQVNRRTETGEAPAWQGATTENTASNREYLREEQRSQTGCSAGRMQAFGYASVRRSVVLGACSGAAD